MGIMRSRRKHGGNIKVWREEGEEGDRRGKDLK